MAIISFHGAAGMVTGSCHLIQTGGRNFLLDAGQFQGPWSIESLNYKPFGFNPSELDGLILSHGHLDHCGRIPVLSDQGFSGHIYCTPPTRDIARLILLDSAYILKEEFLWKKKRLARAGIEAKSPLYSLEDVYYCLDQFDRTVDYHETVQVAPDVSLRFHSTDAGHILGSAQAYLEFRDSDGSDKKLLYTGDIGDGDRPVVNDPEDPEKGVDVLVMESTYGNRDHKSYEDSIKELEEAVTTTVRRRGTVLIPTFALERTQEILYHLGQMKQSGKLSRHVPVFLNSPLAIDITRLYHKHCDFCRTGINDTITTNKTPFVFPGLHLTETVEESKAIHSVPGPKIVLAGSGMMTGGRIKHHLKHHLWQETTTLVVVGFQAEGTLGRKIVDGADTVRIFGAPVSVKARIYTINGFSAHAAKKHLVNFARNANPRKIFLVHGESSALTGLSSAIRKALPDTAIKIPKLGHEYRL